VSAFRADLKRTLFAPATIATLLIAALLAGLLSAGPPPPPAGLAGIAVSYDYDDGVVLWLYAYNGSGAPLSGYTFFASLAPFANVSGNVSAPLPSVNGTGTTGANGFARILLASNASSGFVRVNVTQGPLTLLTGFSLSAAPPRTVLPGSGTFALIDVGRYGLSPEMLVVDPGPDGGPPTGASVLIEANTSPPDPGETVVGTPTLDAAVSVIDLPVRALPPLTFQVNYTLRGANGAPLVTEFAVPSELAVLPYTNPSWGSALANDASLWGFLAPVLGVGVGFAAYARERGARALEPVVALPTTRFGIFGRRYLAGCVPLVLATGLVVLVEFDLLGPIPTGIAPALLLGMWGSLLLAAVAFLGVTVLVAHLLRSGAAVVAVGIGLAAFLAYFIVPLEYLLGELQGVYPSLGAMQQAQLVNPTFLPNGALAGYFAGLGSPGILPMGAVAGATQLSDALGVTALLAVVTPILAALLAHTRD
jgi:hypothetical protein